jgi:hypothetical protein
LVKPSVASGLEVATELFGALAESQPTKGKHAIRKMANCFKFKQFNAGCMENHQDQVESSNNRFRTRLKAKGYPEKNDQNPLEEYPVRLVFGSLKSESA